jgi:uncharacterized membrane protein YeiH
LSGTAVFAAEGAAVAIASGLDVLGVLVLSFSSSLVGGMIRDVLIGSVPPRAIADWLYSATALAAGAVTFVFYEYVPHVPRELVVGLDAAGLSLFAVAGAGKALDYGIPAFSAVLLGGITAVGGGVVRDVLLAHVPNILRTDIYGTAALAGAAVLVAGRKTGAAPAAVTVAGFMTCFVLRLVAVWQHWNLPAIRP